MTQEEIDEHFYEVRKMINDNLNQWVRRAIKIDYEDIYEILDNIDRLTTKYPIVRQIHFLKEFRRLKFVTKTQKGKENIKNILLEVNRRIHKLEDLIFMNEINAPKKQNSQKLKNNKKTIHDYISVKKLETLTGFLKKKEYINQDGKINMDVKAIKSKIPTICEILRNNNIIPNVNKTKSSQVIAAHYHLNLPSSTSRVRYTKNRYDRKIQSELIELFTEENFSNR